MSIKKRFDQAFLKFGMKKIMSCVLVMVLLASAVPLAVIPAGAQQVGIPCDDGNNELTRDELVNAILPYMLGEGSHTLDEVGDAAWVYAYWGGQPKTITDSYRFPREVTMYKPIERIIVLSTGGPAAPLCLLGVEDKIVGINGMIAKSPSYPDLNDLPPVGYPGPNYEAIVELEPDLVIACTYAWGSAEFGDVSTLDSLGIKAVMFDYGNPATLPEEMETLGEMMGEEERADEYIEFFHTTLSLVDKKVDELPEMKTVYYEFAIKSTNTHKTAGYGSKIDAKITRAGGKNIFADVRGPSFEVDPEAVLEEDPDVVIIDAHATCSIYEMEDTIELEEFRDEIINNRPGWDNMTAAKNDDIYLFVHETFCSIHVPVGMYYLVRTLYPDNFSDLDPDPDVIKNEYLEEFFPDREYLMGYQGPHVYPCKWCD